MRQFIKYSFLLCVLYNNASFAEYLYPPGISISPIGVPTTEYFDLSYVLDENTLFFPGQRFDYTLFRDIQGFNETTTNHNKFWFAMYSLCMGEHGGTHVDAPFHFDKTGWKVAEIPLNRQADVPAAVIDVADLVFGMSNPYEFILTVEHIREHEAKHGLIPVGGIVLVHFGWSRFWPDKEKYFGTGSSNPAAMRFPGLSGEAAKWLLKERRIIGLGVDTASADHNGSAGGDLPVHITLLNNKAYIIENVANLSYLLSRIRPRDYPTYPLQRVSSQCNLHVHVLPTKTLGTGAQARILAYCKK